MKNSKLETTNMSESLQSINKKKQGYIAKPIIPNCANCKYFLSDKIANQYNFVEEKNMRCNYELAGGFAVKKNGTCAFHVMDIPKK